MREDEDGLQIAVDHLYAAAAGDASWSQALKSCADDLGGAGSVVFDMDTTDGEILSWQSHGLEDGEQEYVEHLNEINPRMHYSLHRDPGHVVHDRMVMSENEMDRHEFYDAIESLSGVRYFLGSKVQQRGNRATFTSVEFTRRHGNAQAGQLKRFSLLTRHLRNAWNIGASVDRLVAERDREVFVNDRLPWGVVCLDHQGRIIDTNTIADAILASGDGLGTAGGGLCTAKAAENRSLRVMIANLLASPFDAGARVDALSVSRPSGLPAYGLQFVPYIRNHAASARPPAVIVYITDPMSRSLVSPDHLFSLFGLSSREAGIAISIGNGHSLTETARSLGISVNTARNHLRSVFRKTEVCSQVDLVRLLTRLLPDRHRQ